MLFISLLLVGLSAISATVAAPLTRRGVNDFSCKPSSADQRPLVFLHGLGATYYEDLNFMQDYFSNMSYCTFSITYGAYDGFPYVGGLKAIDESAPQLAAYIETVLEKTGASQVDLIGHSEGGFMSLYLPKFDAKGKVRRVAAIAPPSHGTDFASLYKLALALGPAGTTLTKDVLDLFGCDACADLVVGSPIINRLNNGGIAQSGVQYTIITSKADELVTPAPAASFVSEAGVRNVLIQDVCPNGECPLRYQNWRASNWPKLVALTVFTDPHSSDLDAIVGHISEAYDTNTWNIVQNAIENTPDRQFTCVAGTPGR